MTPTISVNKLGEYLEATPTRRKQIVIDQKAPSPFIVTRYSDAKEITIQYFISGFDKEILVRAIDRLENTSAKSNFRENDIANSILYLQKLQKIDIESKMNFSNLVFSKYEGQNPKLNIDNVEISVNPDLIISGTLRGKKIKGAIKLHTSKSNQLNDNSSKNVAILVNKFVRDYLAKDDETANLMCSISFDVFADIWQPAPKSIKMRLKQIAIACTEINLWWKEV